MKHNIRWFYIPAIITSQRMTGSAFKGGGLCRIIRMSEFTWREPEFSAENQQEILLESDKKMSTRNTARIRGIPIGSLNIQTRT